MNEWECRGRVKVRSVRHDPSMDAWSEYAPCEFCGIFTNTFEMHHRQFRSRGGLWIPSNVILLCGVCHRGATDERVHGTGLNVHTWEVAAAVPVEVWYAEAKVLFDDEGGYSLVA